MMPSLYEVEVPEQPPKKQAFLEWGKAWLDNKRIQRNFAEVRIKGHAWVNQSGVLPSGAIFCANTISPWDPLLGYLVLRKIFQLDPYLMLEQEALTANPQLARLGGIGIDRTTPTHTIKSLQFAAELLRGAALPGTRAFNKSRPRGLWLQPDLPPAEDAPPDAPLRCRLDAAYLARTASGWRDGTGKFSRETLSSSHSRMSARLKKAEMTLAVIPVAITYKKKADESDARNRAFIEFGKPWDIGTVQMRPQEWTVELEERMNDLLTKSRKGLEVGETSFERFV